MTMPLKLTLVAILVALMFTTASSVTTTTPNAEANPCRPGDPDYNYAACIQMNPQCSANPALCAGSQQIALPASVTINSPSNSLNCGATMSLVVVVAQSGGAPASNTAVSLSASAGQITPSSGTSNGGMLTALYTAPPTAGTATITATVNTMTATKALTITCPAPSTTAPTTAQPPSTTQPPAAPVFTSPPPPPPAGGVIFSPPNTGDGGLLAGHRAKDYAAASPCGSDALVVVCTMRGVSFA
jgi:hypothetical protein